MVSNLNPFQNRDKLNLTSHLIDFISVISASHWQAAISDKIGSSTCKMHCFYFTQQRRLKKDAPQKRATI